MAIDLNNLLANALLDRYDTEFPAGSILEIRSGALQGAEVADVGTVLWSLALPVAPWTAAATGAKTKNGSWSANAIATGTAGHYRLRNVGDTRREEGTVTAAGGGGDAIIDNVAIVNGQPVTVNTFTRTL